MTPTLCKSKSGLRFSFFAVSSKEQCVLQLLCHDSRGFFLNDTPLRVAVVWRKQVWFDGLPLSLTEVRRSFLTRLSLKPNKCFCCFLFFLLFAPCSLFNSAAHAAHGHTHTHLLKQMAAVVMQLHSEFYPPPRPDPCRAKNNLSDKAQFLKGGERRILMNHNH